MKLSVSMIVKNEEKCIGTALDSVRDADEIVVLDTGSTDGTADVIAGLNMPNVRHVRGEYEWKDDFADARNEALARCTGDWALVLDADDWMVDGAVSSIKAAARNSRNKTLNCRIEHEGCGADFYLYPKVLKLNCGVCFVGADHEVPNVLGAGPPVATMILGRSINHASDPDRTLRIMTREHEKDPENTRTIYYLAREYYYRRDYEKAIPLFKAHTQKSTYLAERADAYLYLARMFWALAQGDNARMACMFAITINSNFAEALRFMAEISFEHNAVQWRKFAKLATNERVLFVRGNVAKCCA